LPLFGLAGAYDGSRGRMKKKFWVAVALILSMAAVIVGWGAWLNYSDENQIARRMVSRSVELTVLLDAIRFSSDSMTDAMALTEGRIVRWNVEKNDEVRQGDVLASVVSENIPLKIQQAESAIARADAMLAQAKSNYERRMRPALGGDFLLLRQRRHLHH